MATDFETHLTLSYQSYIENNLLTENQVEKLKELDDYFNERSGNKSSDFWDEFLLEKNPEWQIVRQKARTILELIGMQDLTIEFDRKEEYELADCGERLKIQTTKTRLIRKSAS